MISSHVSAVEGEAKTWRQLQNRDPILEYWSVDVVLIIVAMIVETQKKIWHPVVNSWNVVCIFCVSRNVCTRAIIFNYFYFSYFSSFISKEMNFSQARGLKEVVTVWTVDQPYNTHAHANGTY